MFATGKWVVIEQDETEEKTKGGIIIPDKYKAKHRPARGKIIEAGIDCNQVKKDDEVIFSQDGAFTDLIGETVCVFLHEEDVMVVLNRDAIGFESLKD